MNALDIIGLIVLGLIGGVVLHFGFSALAYYTSPSEDNSGPDLCPYCRAETGAENDEGRVYCPTHGWVPSKGNFDPDNHNR